jgi:hypothetical protein
MVTTLEEGRGSPPVLKEMEVTADADEMKFRRR